MNYGLKIALCDSIGGIYAMGKYWVFLVIGLWPAQKSCPQGLLWHGVWEAFQWARSGTSNYDPM